MQRFYTALTSETGITASIDSPGVGTLVKVAAAEMDSVWAFLEELYNQSTPTTATGSYLDEMGLLIGVPRRQDTRATTTGQTPSIRFTNMGGTPANVPAGTRVYKAGDPAVAFFTIEGAAIGVGLSVDVHATAASAGQAYNVAIGELTKHSAPLPSVSVTNLLPIQNGSLRESDASYRERILQEMRRRHSLTPENAVALLRGVDGVRDVLMLNMARGRGTFDAVVLPYHRTQSADVVSECSRVMAQAAPIGIDYQIRAPRERQLDLAITLGFVGGATTQEADRQMVRSLLSARVDALGVEDGTGVGSLYLSQLRATAVASGPSIYDAAISGSLDDVPLSTQGEVRVARGERIVLRSLAVR